ncbi:AfsR/SARP family transcriptional regulator [Nocardia goodfellowii]|uniref:DNA-binding SARP family transcriptional activator n=1 Tax=Nocardia goodfellowii TaxID=882446 RepID=A0ABS4QEU7_9NOCA|nr:BTAD domain-containing putative transcriptional regulator [Nocardia goodfellowii]MBP2189665.1 DNA-binding SARP family transcriptional activator [Nocardia goodfellowii]
MTYEQCRTSNMPMGTHRGEPVSPYSYRVLGALEVRRFGRRVDVPKGNTLNVLAALLLNANAVVSSDTLIERIWGDDPPKTVKAILQNSISRLRSLSSPAHSSRAVPMPVVTEPHGYSIRVQDGTLDIHRFDHMVSAAEAARTEGRTGDAANLLYRALSSWKNNPLSDVTAAGLQRIEIRQLNERRVGVLDRWADLELDSGHSDKVIPELRAAIAAYPTAERLRYQLVRALADNQQLGEASQLLRETEIMLRERYGLEARPVLERWWRQLVIGASAEGVHWPQIVNT